MKNFFLVLISFLVLFFWLPTALADVVYSIPSYQGDLVIHEDNTVDFTQTITFAYDSDFRGQYVTLGTAGNLPTGFAISGEPEVTASRNGQAVAVQTELETWQDGHQVKVYNGGEAGDVVVLTVIWHLSQMLFHYEDIAELNWIPISDWDVPLEQVTLTVATDKEVSQHDLKVHRGYFKNQSRVDFDQLYTIRAEDVSGQLELHAYWDRAILSGQPDLADKGLEKFLAVENQIVQKEEQLAVLIGRILPAISLGLLALGAGLYYRYRSAISPKIKPQHRVYELPEDASPLVVAKQVYEATLLGLAPGGSLRLELSLENVLQAGLLDLLDRRLLSLEQEDGRTYACRTDRQGLADFEESFLHLAMGARERVALDDLFKDYAYDQTTEKRLKKSYSGRQLESQMRAYAKHYLSKFEDGLYQVDQAIVGELLGRESNYRNLIRSERFQFSLSQSFLFLACLVALISFIISIVYHQVPYIFLFLGLGFISFMLICINLSAYLKDSTIGVPTPVGRQVLQDWNGFRQMLKDIKTFERVDLEGLVVWNRMLVFATLFGHAKEVQRYMKKHGISLPADTGLATVAYHPALFRSAISHNLIASSQRANQTSHFSVSSGGGASGGFSGGGGGGGGGGSF